MSFWMPKYTLVTTWTDASYTKIKDYQVYLGDNKKGFAQYKKFTTEKQAQDFINKNK